MNLILSLQENTHLVNIGGKRTRGLVDTGATISCASLSYLKKTNLNTTKLKPAAISHISGVGNENHAVLGKLEIPVVISGKHISFDFYVLENLRHRIIFGMDFLKCHKVRIDIHSKQVYIQEEVASACLIKTNSGLARTCKGITIPARSQVNAILQVSRRRSGETVLLEPIPGLHSRNIAAARSLVCVSQGRAPMRLLNPTKKDIYLPGHKVIATVFDIDDSNIHFLDDNSTQNVSFVTENSGGSTSDKDNSGADDINFNISDSGLSQTQRSELLQFLKRNKDVFSTSLQDSGKTDLYQHKIETDPSAPPVHLPFYRQAPHVRAEIDRQVNDMLNDGIIQHSNSVWTVILSLPLIQEGQLSVSGERMCTILVNRLEDKACPVNVWLGKLTALNMTPLG